MSRTRRFTASRLALCLAALVTLPGEGNGARESPRVDQDAQSTAPAQFGGSYASLGARRQKFVTDWLARFNELTGKQLQAEAFYDTTVKLSAKTTFDAVTNALITTPLTDKSGAKYGDALDLVERVESVRGEILDTASDHQFRMYVRLVPDVIDRLDRSQQFDRGADNSFFHKGYPINYRQQGGSPSIQISIAADRRRADIDVDYRSSRFPLSLFNGHLTSANSDVRAGDNFDRHTNRWSGFQNWWRSLFGVRVSNSPDPNTVPAERPLVPSTPRAGKRNIDVMVDDFLRAWLVDNDVLGAMSYISERAYACLAQDGDERFAFDRGLAPFQVLQNLKAAHDALGPHASLDGLVVGVRLTTPALRVVQQPHHAQFVIYSVPDDVATKFDCESRLTLATKKNVSRAYGNYYGATFYLNSRKDYSMALLWAKEDGAWKIVSWQTEPQAEEDATATAEPPAAASVAAPRATMKADPALVSAAKGFLESWLIRKDYDTAFRYLAPESYACHDPGPDPNAPARSSADAAALTRSALERSGAEVGNQARLDTLISAVPPVHPAVRLLDHPYAQTFTLTSVPNATIAAADCAARAQGGRWTGDLPLEYGQAFGMNLRFRTRSGEPPVLRVLWVKDQGAWRIRAYAVEYP